jgi:lia operon protein LiaF
MKPGSGFGAIVLIVLGSLFLLANLGVIPRLGPLLATWWPLILILVGVSLLLRRR